MQSIFIQVVLFTLTLNEITKNINDVQSSLIDHKQHLFLSARGPNVLNILVNVLELIATVYM